MAYRLAALSVLASAAVASPLARRDYVGDLSGCGISHDFVGHSQDQNGFHSGNHDRDYLVHLPENYDENTPTALVLAFHGHSADRFNAQDEFEFSNSDGDTDNTDGKIYVYPQGIKGTDNLTAWGGAPYSTTSADEDKTFINDLLTHLRQRYCIDSSRIYATGHSNGGGFVNTLACDANVGANFAAFAPASGAFYDDNSGPDDGCQPARPFVPVMESHGGSDGTISYDGGERYGVNLPNIYDWASWWATRNGCDGDAAEEDLNDGDVHHYSWTCQGVQGAVQHYKVDDMDHVWPSTDRGNAPISYAPLVRDFFNKFTRPA